MRLPTFGFTHLGSAFAFFLLLPVAHAAEVSTATRVETSPGLTPQAVKRVFDQKRQALAPCMRLLTENKPSGNNAWNPREVEVDDRILLTFSVGADGKVRPDERHEDGIRVEGLYLDAECAGPVVRSWTFPTFPGRRDEAVRVEIHARFSTTADERKAAVVRLREDLEAMCRALSAVDAGGSPPSQKEATQALERLLAERRSSLSPRVAKLAEALMHVNPQDLATLYAYGGEELMGTPPNCPKVRGWMPKEE